MKDMFELTTRTEIKLSSRIEVESLEREKDKI